MIIGNGNIRIPSLHLSEPSSGNTVKAGNRTADNRFLKVITSLVQTSHGVQIVVELFHVRSARNIQSESDNSHTTIRRNVFQNIQNRNRRAAILNSQCRDTAVIRHRE